MNVQQLKQMITSRNYSAVENAWMQAAQEDVAPKDLASVLEALSAAGQGEQAATMAWASLSERVDSQPADKMLEIAKALVLVLPHAEELRKQTAELYKKVHGANGHFDMLLTASGLLGGQSPRRAVQTLDICLRVKPGCFLANRFDGHVLLAKGYNDIMGEYELADANGSNVRLDPRNLADEFEVVDEKDFRVLCQHRQDELGQLLKTDPASVLVGICMTHGGQIDATSLKEMLVPRYITASEYGDWWSKARSAIKRCPNLSLEGRAPVTVRYHSGGLTLEEELAVTVAAAKTPLQKLVVLQQYHRESRDRKVALDTGFTAPILAGLANQAVTFLDKRPGDALAASLSLEAARDLGLGSPMEKCAAPQDILNQAPHPAQAVADLADTTLWAKGLTLLRNHPQARDEFLRLLPLTPSSSIDDVAACLEELGLLEAMDKAVAAAFADPINHLDMFVWMWKGPAKTPPGLPSKIELLSRMLKILLEIEHDWSVAASVRKNVNQRLRAALSASDYSSYRTALSTMDEAVAGTIKRLVERAGGLSDAVRGNMLDLLRESFFSLFVKAKIDPWLDENAIWTTEAALRKREDELKELVEIRMLENARAIGAAAEHGDLSENSEWKFAIEERDMLRARAAKLQEEITMARVLRPEAIPTQTVGIGSSVTLRHEGNSQQVTLTFLGPWDSDVTKGLFSYQTPLGQDLMGKQIGDTIHIKMESIEGQYVIEKIAAGLK